MPPTANRVTSPTKQEAASWSSKSTTKIKLCLPKSRKNENSTTQLSDIDVDIRKLTDNNAHEITVTDVNESKMGNPYNNMVIVDKVSNSMIINDILQPNANDINFSKRQSHIIDNSGNSASAIFNIIEPGIQGHQGYPGSNAITYTGSDYEFYPVNNGNMYHTNYQNVGDRYNISRSLIQPTHYVYIATNAPLPSNYSG